MIINRIQKIIYLYNLRYIKIQIIIFVINLQRLKFQIILFETLYLQNN